eukprot:1515606-Rhodomonas_salina.1
MSGSRPYDCSGPRRWKVQDGAIDWATGIDDISIDEDLRGSDYSFRKRIKCEVEVECNGR